MRHFLAHAALVGVMLGYFLFTTKRAVPTDAVTPQPSVDFLRKLYVADNAAYFENSLPTNTKLDFDLRDKRRMAETGAKVFGEFHISLNPEYTLAERTQELILLHEMCHIKTWGETIEDHHGPRWRACMVKIDMMDGFRDILIENYRRKSE